jgi:hypothetical protein
MTGRIYLFLFLGLFTVSCKSSQNVSEEQSAVIATPKEGYMLVRWAHLSEAEDEVQATECSLPNSPIPGNLGIEWVCSHQAEKSKDGSNIYKVTKKSAKWSEALKFLLNQDAALAKNREAHNYLVQDTSKKGKNEIKSLLSSKSMDRTYFRNDRNENAGNWFLVDRMLRGENTTQKSSDPNAENRAFIVQRLTDYVMSKGF